MIDFTTAELLHDTRVNCASFMTSMTVQEYIDLVNEAYKDRGGIAGQREPLKTTSAKRIRKRMVEDLLVGAVLPPVVIGKVVDDLASLDTADALKAAISDEVKGQLSIIDGMQRTTALLEAFAESEEEIKDRFLRVEFWVAEETESLIYRMLVLNTGQVPWNLSRQLQVVYAPLVAEMKEKITFDRVLEIQGPNPERRTKAGQYRPDDLAELFIAFGLRKTDVDTKETLADEFSRLDMAEALSSHLYKEFFYPTVQMMVDLDGAISRLDDQLNQSNGDDETDGRQLVGRNVFDSKPARIGFVVAVAIAVMGRIGMEKDKDQHAMEERIAAIKDGLAQLTDKLSKLDADGMNDFLKLGVLQQRLYGTKRSAVGRYERSFFEDAFKILIDESFDIPTLETCWRG
ncbi:hypothetical protein [Falsiruegeria mediterranea]|uniref:hypothetical protein n=1 Tax=Falsiruegeria mediterranea TaxID=1280832 RepID=UPI0015F279BD|nr:hypothetical protein [Falsiruegeria mediterranea]